MLNSKPAGIPERRDRHVGSQISAMLRTLAAEENPVSGSV